MRNLKRVLSLALAALMLMGMMVVGAGAASKDFTDADEITNVEAVDVMVGLGILEGGDKGDFQPNSILTREQAAKIICYMLLGEENAEKLTTNYSIFSDVPANRWSAPYISYCVNLGILAGDGNGHFFPEGKLTGVAFAKMLMVALGYNAERENFVGNNWEINVSAAAIAAGVAPKALDLSKELSRQDAAQMAFNTLKATMVEYNNDNTIIIGGETIISTTGKATAVAQDPYTDTMKTEYLQFAEKYFSDLKMNADTDAFGRPAHTWVYAKEEIGTYVNEDERVASYTTGVEGGDVYNDLGSTAAKYDLTYYVNGVALSTADTKAEAAKLAKKNDDGMGTTGNGVLTEVFVNSDDEEVTIVEIHSYLAKVNADYNEKTDKVSLTIYTGVNKTGSTPTETTLVRSVSGEDFAIADYVKDDMVVVTFAGTAKEVQSITDPQVVSEVEITAYSTYGKDYENKAYMMKSVTADGEKYNASEDSSWQAEFMYNYTLSQMKDHTWNVYLDQYGYVLGLENVEATTNYAFLVGYQSGSDVLATAIDKALVITIDADNNATLKVVEARDNKLSSAEEDQLFGSSAVTHTNGAINKWVTYEMDDDVMVLKSCVDDQFWSQNKTNPISTEFTTLAGKPIKNDGTYDTTNVDPVYGNSKSVYVAVDADTSVNTNGSIVKINGTSVGIKNTSIEKSAGTTDAYGSYVLYAGGYVKYAVVVGEDSSIADRLVYLTSGITEKYYDKELDKDIYVYEGIVAGEQNDRILSEVAEDNAASPADLTEGVLYVASFDANGIITEMEALADNWTSADTTNNKAKKYVQATSNDDNANGYLDANDEAIDLHLKGMTLYITAATNKHYVLLDDECVFYVRGTDSNGKRYSDYEQFADADNAMAALGNSNKFTGSFVAICDPDTGYATTIIINDAKYEQDDDTPSTGDGEINLSGVKIGGTSVASAEGYSDIDDAVANARTVYLSSAQLAKGLSQYTATTTDSTATAIQAVYKVFNDADSVYAFAHDDNDVGSATTVVSGKTITVTEGTVTALGDGNVVVVRANDSTDSTNTGNLTYFAYIISEKA